MFQSPPFPIAVIGELSDVCEDVLGGSILQLGRKYLPFDGLGVYLLEFDRCCLAKVRVAKVFSPGWQPLPA